MKLEHSLGRNLDAKRSRGCCWRRRRMRMFRQQNVRGQVECPRSSDPGRDGQGRWRVRRDIQNMRLHERGIQGGHGLAAVLTAVMAMLRTGHAVTALHGFIRRGGGKAVQRVRSKSCHQYHHENGASRTHHSRVHVWRHGVSSEQQDLTNPVSSAKRRAISVLRVMAVGLCRPLGLYPLFTLPGLTAWAT